MAGTPAVSVIVAAYNSARHLSKAIESVLHQTLDDFELIIVDDASTDATYEEALRWSAADDRIRVMRHEANCGPGCARNTALETAQGTWVAILDADDHFAPQRLETLVQTGERMGADIVADNQFFVEEGRELPWGTLLRRSESTLRVVDGLEFLNRNMPGRHATLGLLKPLVHRALLKETGIAYHPGLRYGEDFLFIMNLLIYGGAKLVVHGQPMYYYTMRTGSLSSNARSADLAELLTLNEQFLRNAPKELGPSLKRRTKLLRKYAIYREAVTLARKDGTMTGVKRILKAPSVLAFSVSNVARVLFRNIRIRLTDGRS